MAFTTPHSNAGSRRRYKSAVMADINMLPMIDIMLVLLILFMVAAPLIHHAVNIKLPVASNSPIPADTQMIAIAIQPNQQLTVNQQPATLETLHSVLNRFIIQSSLSNTIPVQIYADKTVSYGMVAQVMSAIGAAGLTQLRFVTTPNTP